MSAPTRIFSIVTVVLGGALVLGAPSAWAQSLGKRVFATRESCEISGALSADECRNAHANALAELHEKAPRFESRPECQKEFTQCMIAGFGGRRVEFEPAMRGFEVTSRAAGEKTVVPVLHVDAAALGFRARPVSRPDTTFSQSAHAQAQEKRKQAQQARAAAEAAARAMVPEERKEIEPAFSAAPPSVEAPRAPSQYDLESAARRRKEIESAPVMR